MIHSKKMPLKFWAEAVTQHATSSAWSLFAPVLRRRVMSCGKGRSPL